MRVVKLVAMFAASCGVFCGGVAQVRAQGLPPFEFNTHEAAIVDSSAQVLREIMTIPGKGIPASLLAKSEGIIIVPGMLKGGFVIGAKHGRGVVVVRDGNRNWQMPQFVTINGGSVGWQAGIQATDLVLVFMTKKSVQGLLTGKFTIGADASAAAGPVGREASAATDGRLQAEIYSYSRSRGLFAGLSVDGSKIDIDSNATAVFYRPQAELPAGQAAPVPASAMRLMQEIARYSTTTVDAAAAPINVAAAPVAAANLQAAPNQQVAREQLAAASQRLGAMVDVPWRNYLALPAETYGGPNMPALDGLEQALVKFQTVAGSPQYAALAARPEFKETLQLLQQMIAATPRPAITLPPPPQ